MSTKKEYDDLISSITHKGLADLVDSTASANAGDSTAEQGIVNDGSGDFWAAYYESAIATAKCCIDCADEYYPQLFNQDGALIEGAY